MLDLISLLPERLKVTQMGPEDTSSRITACHTPLEEAQRGPSPSLFMSLNYSEVGKAGGIAPILHALTHSFHTRFLLLCSGRSRCLQAADSLQGRLPPRAGG